MSGDREHETHLRVDPQHPALPGHFPGDPVLPGVVVLEEVMAAAEAWMGGAWRVRALPQVKFLAPLRPEDRAVIRLVQRNRDVRFAVYRGEALVAQGVLAGEDDGADRS